MTTKISSDNIQASTLATIGSGPKISQIQVCDSSYNTLDDTAVDIAGGYIKITGTGFKTGATVTVNRQQATSVTFISSTELRAQVAAEVAGTYVVYVVNTDGSVALRVNGITFSALPSWTTASTLPTGDSGTAISIQLVAAEATTYSVAAGSTLPSGITLSSGGLLTGTINVNDETLYNFSVVATDAQLQDSPRSFSITITVGDPLFAQTTLLLPGSASTFVSDSSTNNLAITVAGDTKPSNFSPYLSQYSTQFNAKTNYVSVPATTALTTFAGDFTFEAWIYPTDTAIPYWKIWDSRQNGATAQAMVLGLDPRSPAVTGQGRLSYFNGSSYYGTGVVQYNRWTHIAFVRSGTTLTFYVDGVAGGTATVSGTQTGTATTNPIWIGTKDNGSASYGTTGHISDLRVVNGTAVYASNFTPPTERLTAITNTVLLTCQDNRYKDNSANNYTLTPSGTSISAFSPFAETASANGSGYFDGTGDWLTVPYSSAFSLGTTYTIEAWVYPTVLSAANHEIFNILNPTIANFGGCIFYVNASGVLYFETRPGTGGTNIALNGGTVPLNTWTHVCVSVSSGAAKLFVNGTQVDFDTVAALNGTQSHVAIGAFTNGFTAYPWFGYISNLRVVKDTALYTANFTPPTQPLTAVSGTSLLTLQNSVSHTNSQFVDSSSNNLLVTRAGNATQGSFSPYSPSGWSNYFDGSGDYLSISSSSAFNISGNFTIEGWYNFTALPPSGQNDNLWVFSGTTTYNPYLYLWGDGTLVLRTTQTGGTVLTATHNFVVGNWYHIALVKLGTTFTLYIDGVSSATGTSSAIVSENKSILIGDSSTFGLQGHLSNFRVVNGTALYTANFTPSTQPLTAIAGTALLTCCDNRFIDESPNNFAITRAGDVRVANFSPHKAVAQTPRSYSAYFDGTGDLLAVPDSDAFWFDTGDFTLEGWAYLNTKTSFCIFQQSNGTSGNVLKWSFYFSNSTNQLLLNGHNPAASPLTWASASWTPVTGKWYHLAATRQSNTHRIFVDGVQIGTDSVVTTAFPQVDSVLQMAGFKDSPVTSPNQLNGLFSNLRIVKGTALYTANFTPSTQPLTAVAGTSLLTCQSAAFTDNSTNNAVLTVSGNSQPITTNPFGTTFTNSSGYTAAEYSGSMYFDGTGDYVTTPSSAFDISGSSSWTIEQWIYPTLASTSQFIWQNYTTSGTTLNGQSLLWDSNNTLLFEVWQGSSAASQFSLRSGTLSINQWHHIAIVRNASGTNNSQLYINGVLAAQGTWTTHTAPGSTLAYIGARNYSGIQNPFKGYVSDLGVVKGTALYTAAFAPPVAPVLPVQNTTLLLKGTAAGIVDATTKNDVETVGDVRISSAVSKFGGSSMRFDGTGDHLTIASAPAIQLGSGSFTVEGWYYKSSSGIQSLYYGGTSGALTIQILDSRIDIGRGGVAYIMQPSYTTTLNTWTHFALVRKGNSYYLFMNGTQVGTTVTDSNSLPDSVFYVGVNIGNGSEYWNGYIQDLRVTKGAARYTANFTPPTSAFNIK